MKRIIWKRDKLVKATCTRILAADHRDDGIKTRGNVGGMEGDGNKFTAFLLLFDLWMLFYCI